MFKKDKKILVVKSSPLVELSKVKTRRLVVKVIPKKIFLFDLVTSNIEKECYN